MKDWTLFLNTNYSESQIQTMRTATLTAYPRIYTDIPFAGDVFISAIRIIAQSGLFHYQPNFFVAEIALELEARYKGINAALNSVIDLPDNTCIIELGSGLSTRDLEYHYITHYYQIDYQPIIELKSTIYNDINPQRKEMMLCADFSDATQFIDALSKIKKDNSNKAFIFVSEGVFWYLTRQTITKMINCIKEVFSNQSLVWITADCPVDDVFLYNRSRSIIAQSSSRDELKPFKDYNDFYSFMMLNGFKILKKKLLDLVPERELKSADLFCVSRNDVVSRLNKYTDIATLFFNG